MPPSRRRDDRLLIIALIVIIIVIISCSVLFSSVVFVNAEENKNILNVSFDSSLNGICRRQDAIDIRAFLVSGKVYISTALSYPGGTPLNNGMAVASLGRYGGRGRVPFYVYTNGTAFQDLYGTSAIPPLGYTVTNEGYPLGYVHIYNATGLSPLYVVSGTLPSSETAYTLSKTTEVTYDGVLYTQYGSVIGYVL